MLDNFPSILRLSLCLLISAGLHGGATFYDWITNPAESRLVHAPVVVSFLPATDGTSKVLSERPRPLPDLALASKRSRVAKAAQPATRQKAEPPVPQRSTAKALPKKSLASTVTEEPKATTPSSEMVCMTPQEVTDDSPPGLSTDSPLASVPEERGVVLNEAPQETPQMAMVAVEDGLLDGASVAAYQSSVEAVPNYRSNPLPEYPYLARQKHWEGVVWLMVDVSTDGSVDDLRIEKSSGHRILDRTARRTVSRWQFSPATRAGLAVSSQVRIPVRFRLEGD